MVSTSVGFFTTCWSNLSLSLSLYIYICIHTSRERGKEKDIEILRTTYGERYTWQPWTLASLFRTCKLVQNLPCITFFPNFLFILLQAIEFFIIAQCLQLLHELLCNFFIFMRWWHSSYFLPKGFSSLQTSYCEPRLLLDDAKLDCVNVSLVHMLCKLWSRPGSFFHPWPPTGLNTDSQSVKHRNHTHSVHYRTLWLHSSLLLYATWAMWIMDAVWHLSD